MSGRMAWDRTASSADFLGGLTVGRTSARTSSRRAGVQESIPVLRAPRRSRATSCRSFKRTPARVGIGSRRPSYSQTDWRLALRRIIVRDRCRLRDSVRAHERGLRLRKQAGYEPLALSNSLDLDRYRFHCVFYALEPLG